jgi:flagellar protein FlbD
VIRLTRINHQEVILNSDLIEHMEANPDTVITLTTGQKMMVLETPEEIIERIIRFRRHVAERNASVETSALADMIDEQAG